MIQKNNKETSEEIIQSSIREVNYLFNKQVDQLQKELLETKADANTRLILLNKELREQKEANKANEELVISLKSKIKEMKRNTDISLKAATYRLEKSE